MRNLRKPRISAKNPAMVRRGACQNILHFFMRGSVHKGSEPLSGCYRTKGAEGESLQNFTLLDCAGLPEDSRSGKWLLLNESAKTARKLLNECVNGPIFAEGVKMFHRWVGALVGLAMMGIGPGFSSSSQAHPVEFTKLLLR